MTRASGIGLILIGLVGGGFQPLHAQGAGRDLNQVLSARLTER